MFLIGNESEGGSGSVHDREMQTLMNLDNLTSIDQLAEFWSGTQTVAFSVLRFPAARDACQGSCRLSYALLRFSVRGSRAALIAASRSGFKVTTAIGDQLRVGPDQRRGCLALASWYRA